MAGRIKKKKFAGGKFKKTVRKSASLKSGTNPKSRSSKSKPHITKPKSLSSKPALEYVSWTQVQSMCEQLAEKVRRFAPHVLIGVSRGGLVPVRLLSDSLNNHTVATIRIEFYKSMEQTTDFPRVTQPISLDIRGLRVLIVDDVVDTGRSLLVAKELARRGMASDVKVATIHYKPRSLIKPDFYIKETNKWLVYPWEVHEVKNQLKHL
ncbi:MAG: phosphoribosyltransferase [Candidatus Micrarchaeota archaeon]